jgi:NADPH:quinone reductase-like Zn-dependent oxidoreductase
LVRRLGADVAVDCREDDFETVLHGCDVVLHSLDAAAPGKSPRVLEPGGRLISISGPPDPAFALQIGGPWVPRPAARVLSHRARKAARRRRVSYSFLFMRADGGQLRQITALTEAGIIEPVIDRVFPFESTNEAMAHVETGRAKGKVVVKVR